VQRELEIDLPRAHNSTHFAMMKDTVLFAAIVLLLPTLVVSFSTFTPNFEINYCPLRSLTSDAICRQTPMMSTSTRLNYQNDSDLEPFGGRRRSKPSSFARRMRNMVTEKSKETRPLETLTNEPQTNLQESILQGELNVKMVTTLDQFKNLLVEEKDRMVVVRWYATWCRACAAVKPKFYRLANAYRSRTDIVFVEVPVTEQNADLHQGLGVPTLPFSHIYYPGSGLTEELKMVKPHFKRFEETVRWYASGSCDVPDGDSSNPFPPEEDNL